MRKNEENFRFKLKSDYGEWIEQLLHGDDGHVWNGYFLTFMFNHIPGSFDHRCSTMTNAIERVYNTLGNHVVRNLRSPSQRQKLPKLYAFPDYPRKKLKPVSSEDVDLEGVIITNGYDRQDIERKKSERNSLRDATANDGLHYHGILLIRPDTRLPTTVDKYMEQHSKHFVKEGGPIRRIYIEPIDRTPRQAVGYGFKAVEYRIPDVDQLLILPKSLSELPDKGKRVGGGIG